MVSPHGLHPRTFNCSLAHLRKQYSNKSAVPISYRAQAVRLPAHHELATGGPDEVGTRKILVPDSDKWGTRF